MVGYIKRSAATIVRIYTMYEPLKVFTYIGSLVFLVGLRLAAARFLYYYLAGEARARHLASLIRVGGVHDRRASRSS